MMDVLPHEFLRNSLQGMYDYAGAHKVEVKEIPLDVGRGLNVARNHTELANYMWGDWLLIVGSDHSFQPNALNMLLDAAATEDGDCVRPIISGVCVYRTWPYQLIAYRRDPSGKNFMSLRPGIDWGFDDTMGGKVIDQQDGACGSGFCLYHRSVFDEVPYPWFDPGVRMDDLVSYGPDLRICADAAKYGIKSSFHFGVEVMHWNPQPVEVGRSLQCVFSGQEWMMAELMHMNNEGINEKAVQKVRKQCERLMEEKHRAEDGGDERSGGADSAE